MEDEVTRRRGRPYELLCVSQQEPFSSLRFHDNTVSSSELVSSSKSSSPWTFRC
jgi:hypothetical protein